MATFEETVQRFRKTPLPSPLKILSVDPGGTTGLAVFQGTQLDRAVQIGTLAFPGAFLLMEDQLDRIEPTHVVCESYFFYGGQTTRSQTGSHIPVAQLIGVLRFLCLKRGIPVIFQSAAVGKGFVTDEKLKEWEFYRKGEPHARDAIRHGAHALIFHDFGKLD